jgi:hypothetical protein
LPKDIDALAVRFTLSLPNEVELDKIVREEASAYSRENSGKRVQIHANALKAVVRNLKGLAASDARRIARRIVAADGMITDADLPAVAKAKFELLNKAGVLSFEYETIFWMWPVTATKAWVQQRPRPFLGERPRCAGSAQGAFAAGCRAPAKSGGQGGGWGLPGAAVAVDTPASTTSTTKPSESARSLAMPRSWRPACCGSTRSKRIFDLRQRRGRAGASWLFSDLDGRTQVQDFPGRHRQCHRASAAGAAAQGAF